MGSAGVVWRRRTLKMFGARMTRVSGSPVWSSHQNQRTATQHDQLGVVLYEVTDRAVRP